MDEDTSAVLDADLDLDLDAEDKQPEKIDIEAIEERAAKRAEDKIRAELAANVPIVRQPRASRVAAVRSELVQKGFEEDALDRILTMQAAMLADAQDDARLNAQVEASKRFVDDCFDSTREAVEDVLEPLPMIRELGAGTLHDLTEKTAELIMNDKRFAAAARGIKEGRKPSMKVLKEAAAIVADKTAKRMGLQAKPNQLDLTSSKPQPKEDTAGVESLPPNARRIYELNLRAGIDEKTAKARAKQAAKEL